MSVKDLLAQTCHVDTDDSYDIVVYDQCTTNPAKLSPDCFLVVLLKKLERVFNSVSLLCGKSSDLIKIISYSHVDCAVAGDGIVIGMGTVDWKKAGGGNDGFYHSITQQ